MAILYQREERRIAISMLIVILGPTATGKSDLAVALAKKFKGEIISADARQIYKGLNIGSGKVTKEEMKGILHHLLDVANPKRKFTVAQFQKLAFKKIKEIEKRGKVPFLVGGTGFYIQSVVEGISIPEVKPNWKLRKKMAQLPKEGLFLMLKKLDPKRAGVIDPNNSRRLIRAIEIVKATGKPVPKIKKLSPNFSVLQIGIKKSPNELKKTIHKRLYKRLQQGLVKEVKYLHTSGLSWKRLEELGLEYRYVARYLQNKISYREMADALEKEIWRFAKRQMTWFKRDKRIHWISKQKEAYSLIKKFHKKNPL